MGVMAWLAGIVLAVPISVFMSRRSGEAFLKRPLQYAFSLDGRRRCGSWSSLSYPPSRPSRRPPRGACDGARDPLLRMIRPKGYRRETALIIAGIVRAPRRGGAGRTALRRRGGGRRRLPHHSPPRCRPIPWWPTEPRLPVKRAELSFPAAGRVTAVSVAAGDAVTAGQVLAQLDDTRPGSTVAAADAQVTAAPGERRADQSRCRCRPKRPGQGPGHQERPPERCRRLALRRGHADILAARAPAQSGRKRRRTARRPSSPQPKRGADQAHAALADLSIKAPFAGTVTDVPVKVGDEAGTLAGGRPRRRPLDLEDRHHRPERGLRGGRQERSSRES